MTPTSASGHGIAAVQTASGAQSPACPSHIAPVAHEGRLAVHDRRRPHDPAAVDLADALVTQADAEHRSVGAEAADDLVARARVLGPARPGRDEHCVGIEADELVGREGVVAVDRRFGAELAQVLDEVVDERVVVVDDEHPRPHGRRR